MATDRELLKGAQKNSVGSVAFNDDASGNVNLNRDTAIAKAHRRLVNYVIPVTGSAGTDYTHVITASLPRKVKLISASWTEVASVSAPGVTNYQTFTVKKYDSAGANATTLASIAVTTAITAFTPRTITLSATASDLEVASGSVLVLTDTKTGTGRATPIGTCITLDVEEI